MHDPLTVAFELKSPWKRSGYRSPIITIWHKDPCKDGTDNSCDWWGHKKRTPQIDAFGKAVYDLETILDNKPYFPDHPAHLRFQPIKDVYWEMKKKSRFRWHPKYHFWHWRIQFRPWQSFYRWAFEKCCFCKQGFKWEESVIGNWDGDKIWHHRCNKNCYVSPEPTTTEGEK